MTIERITYSESVEAINASGNKKWFKSGIEVADVNNEATKATTIAKEYVSETIKKSLEDNPSYIPDPATYHSETKFTKATDLVKKESMEEQFLKSVGEVTDIKELEKVWKKICDNPKYPTLKKAYEEKFAELSK